MTPASAGSPKGGDAKQAPSRSDNIAVGRQADAPETIALTQSQQAILNGLSGTQRQALCRAEPDGNLGGYFVRWWHTNGPTMRALCRKELGVSVWSGLVLTPLGLLLRTTLLQANRNGK